MSDLTAVMAVRMVPLVVLMVVAGRLVPDAERVCVSRRVVAVTWF